MEGPDVFGGIMWVFTLGTPPEDLMEGFARLTEAGTTDWVLIPIMKSVTSEFVNQDVVSVGFIPVE